MSLNVCPAVGWCACSCRGAAGCKLGKGSNKVGGARVDAGARPAGGVCNHVAVVNLPGDQKTTEGRFVFCALRGASSKRDRIIEKIWYTRTLFESMYSKPLRRSAYPHDGAEIVFSVSHIFIGVIVQRDEVQEYIQPVSWGGVVL